VSELVLIVDDNEQNAKLARDVLELAGMRTLWAQTAEEGISLAHERLPNLILMDLQLPDLDGAEAARRLASDRGTAPIPVVVLSALPTSELDPWLHEAGFAAAIGKPFDVREFPELVRRYCTRA
jgi:two-component system, cell cycle response regulator DivK